LCALLFRQLSHLSTTTTTHNTRWCSTSWSSLEYVHRQTRISCPAKLTWKKLLWTAKRFANWPLSYFATIRMEVLAR
jgi:hypothetical protein